MSYTIEYNRQFIKSERGVTPCWLAGDNNVTEISFRGKERRAREWSVFHNLLGVKEQDILDCIQGSLGRYGQHWRKNGKWVDDAGLIRWIKSGCKAAATVEDILTANRMRAVRCFASVWTKMENEHVLDRHVSTTAEFDAWLDDTIALRETCPKDGRHLYPIIDFGTETLVHPHTKTTPAPEWVVLQRGSGSSVSYLAELLASGSRWSGNIKDALVLDYGQADILKHTGDSWLRKAKLINAEAKNFPYNAAIQFVDGTRAGSYVLRRTNRRLYTTVSKKSAHRYKNQKAAEDAMKKMQPPFKHVGTMAVVLLED